MTKQIVLREIGVNRKLRAHKKSRQGCGNCKLRKVKCDEGKPRCKKCAAFGVVCNYDGRNAVLQLSSDRAFNLDILETFPHPLNRTIPSIIAPSLKQQLVKTFESSLSCPLEEQDLELLSKFQARTVFTISTNTSLPIYQNEIIKLACLVRTLGLPYF